MQKLGSLVYYQASCYDSAERCTLFCSNHCANGSAGEILRCDWSGKKVGACRQGDTDKVVQMLEGSAPTMPDCARKAVMELVHSRPEFYPMPSWTHLSQLHGPKVGVCRLLACTFMTDATFSTIHKSQPLTPLMLMASALANDHQ